MTRFVEGLRRFGSKIIDGIGRFGTAIGKVLRPIAKPALRLLRNFPGKIGKLASGGLRDVHDEEADKEFREWVLKYYKDNPDQAEVDEHGQLAAVKI